MPTSFPTSVDNLTDPVPTNQTTSPSHAGQHVNANDAIEAIETHLGTTTTGSQRLPGYGTSFPGSPTTGHKYWRSDLALEFYYTGTRWLTTQLFTMQINGPDGGAPTWTTTATVIGRQPVLSSQYQMYLERLFIAARVATTNNGSNYWTFALMGEDGASASVLIASADTSSMGSDAFYKVNSSIAALLLTTYDVIWVEINKNGSPGGLIGAALFTYRLVAT